MTSKERYIDKVVSMMIKNDITFNKLIPKGINRFVTEDCYVTELMDYRFMDPMAFFKGPNWLVIRGKIREKYAVSNVLDLERIKDQLEEYFIQNN
mgnify:CR=1 FL=1